MKKKYLFFKGNVIFSAAAVMVLGSCNVDDAKNQEKIQAASVTVQQPKAESIIENWPETPKKVANEMMKKYGNPDEMTATMLIWNKKGPWKRTTVYKEEVPHHFPKEHTDVLEQTIDFQYPINKYDELTAYDGSVFAERTKGELSARCDREEMNFLAINLANDVAKGTKTVEQARMAYAKNVKEVMDGKTPKYSQGFAFDLPKGNQRDPDQAIMDKVMAKEKEMKSDKAKN